MEAETCSAAKEKDADEDKNVCDPSSTTGDNADQDQQILIDTRNINWYRSTLSLDYFQPVFLSVVEDEIGILHKQTKKEFGGQLCKEATTEDITKSKTDGVIFKHICPARYMIYCQRLLDIIKRHTSNSIKFYDMIKDTDPQNWLKSPFEFVLLFLKNRMRCKKKDFKDCDISALCCIVQQCNPLMQKYGTKSDRVRKVRNMTFHCSRMSIDQQEMENAVDAILDFLQHIKPSKNTDEVSQAMERIKKVKSGDIRLQQCSEVIQGWLPGARKELEHKFKVANNLHENILYVENELNSLSPEVATTIKEGDEPNFGEKSSTEKLVDEKSMLQRKYEDMFKRLEVVKGENQDLEKQKEQLIKLLEKTTKENEEFQRKEKERKEKEKNQRKEKERKEKEEIQRKHREMIGRLQKEKIQEKISRLKGELQEQHAQINDISTEEKQHGQKLFDLHIRRAWRAISIVATPVCVGLVCIAVGVSAAVVACAVSVIAMAIIIKFGGSIWKLEMEKRRLNSRINKLRNETNLLSKQLRRIEQETIKVQAREISPEESIPYFCTTHA